ncbi:MAG: MarR family transcriptional regulator [Rhodocyclaceae bacterium]|jgi:DNA-binding MarR family transcriptional regulator|nr:MarR family transcriptional regulator [Rhodocyclaceae bacterium]
MELENYGYLLGETARILVQRFDEYARANGITHTQWMLLIALLRQEGINQTQLARYMEVEPISLSRMVDRLQSAGLVRRVEDPKDRRIRTLYLTDEAGVVLQRLRSFGAQVLGEMSEGVPPEEIQQFEKTVSRFRANLLNATGRPVAVTPDPAAAGEG